MRAAGILAGILAGALAAIFISTFAEAATTVTAAPPNGPPTSSVTLTGAGFDASTVIDVYFDSAEIALAISTAAGAVSANISIPASAQSGSHWITLVERRTSAAAQASFLVLVNWP